MPDGTKVTLYTTEPCGFCRQAKSLLESRGVDYREVNLAKNPEGYNPRRNPDAALRRRNQVIEAMEETRVLTRAEANAAAETALNLSAPAGGGGASRTSRHTPALIVFAAVLRPVDRSTGLIESR